jgi:Fe-S-cluster containining protein
MLEQYTTSCKRGCYACCRMPVQSSVEEALVIVAAYPEAVRRALPELRAQEARLTELSADLERPYEPPDAGTFAKRWWNEGRYCAFLVDGECSVYEARPYACRNYFVLSDPALCGAPAGTKVQMATPVDRSKGFSALASCCNGELRMGLLPTTMLGALGEQEIDNVPVGYIR